MNPAVELTNIRNVVSTLSSDLAPDVMRPSDWTLSSGASIDVSGGDFGIPLSIGGGGITLTAANSRTGRTYRVDGGGGGLGIGEGISPLAVSVSTGLSSNRDPTALIPGSGTSPVFFLAAGNNAMNARALFGGWATFEDLGASSVVGYSAAIVWFSAFPFIGQSSVWADRQFHVKACALIYGAQWVSDVGIGVDIRAYATRVTSLSLT